jgi:hypothetical protein
MSEASLQELKDLAVELLATARGLPPGPDRSNTLLKIGRFSFANNFSARRRLTAGTPRTEGEGEMTDEDESIDPITAAERGILQLPAGREANQAIEGAQEDRGTSAVNQLAQHPAPAIPVKQTKTTDELAAMIHQDLSQIEGCPNRGVKVTVYGLNPWNSLLTFGVEAGPVRNKADLQNFCYIITDRLRRLYDVGA